MVKDGAGREREKETGEKVAMKPGAEPHLSVLTAIVAATHPPFVLEHSVTCQDSANWCHRSMRG